MASAANSSTVKIFTAALAVDARRGEGGVDLLGLAQRAERIAQRLPALAESGVDDLRVRGVSDDSARRARQQLDDRAVDLRRRQERAGLRLGDGANIGVQRDHHAERAILAGAQGSNEAVGHLFCNMMTARDTCWRASRMLKMSGDAI